jgi:hypothetical protein
MQRPGLGPLLGIVVLGLLLRANGQAENAGNRWPAAPEDVARCRSSSSDCSFIGGRCH